MLNEWFVKPRGVAYGVPFMATGISSTGLALPDPNRTRHIRLSVNVATYAVAILVPIGPHCRCVGAGCRRATAFLSLSFLQGLAFFLPAIYLPCT